MTWSSDPRFIYLFRAAISFAGLVLCCVTVRAKELTFAAGKPELASGVHPKVVQTLRVRSDGASPVTLKFASPFDTTVAVHERAKNYLLLSSDSRTGLEGFLIVSPEGTILDFVVCRKPTVSPDGRFVGYLNFIPLHGSNRFGDTIIVYDLDDLPANRRLHSQKKFAAAPDEYWGPKGEMVGIPIFPKSRAHRQFYGDPSDPAEIEIYPTSLSWNGKSLVSIGKRSGSAQVLLIVANTSARVAAIGASVFRLSMEPPDGLVSGVRLTGREACVTLQNGNSKCETVKESNQ